MLLKFIETEKQFDLLKNSYDSLKSDGLAIHCLDWDEIRAISPKLPDGLWVVPLERWKQKLTDIGIKFKEIQLKYGPALVLLRS